jgi:bacterioferritin-associated ferredoxin
MIVCHCKGTTDRQIRTALSYGASCGDDVGRACGGSGMICGGCRPVIESLVQERARKQAKGSKLSSVA